MHVIHSKKIFRRVFLYILVSACDAEDTSSIKNKPLSSKVTLSADNAIDNITSDVSAYISLENKIHATSSVGDNSVSLLGLFTAYLRKVSGCRVITMVIGGMDYFIGHPNSQL